MKSITAVARKELRQLSRDPRTIAVLVVFPALLLLFYGYVLSFDVHHVRLAVLDHDHSATSRALVASMTSSEYFDAVRHLPSAADIPETLDAGTAAIVLVIPRGFEETIQRGGTATVQGLIDGANASQAQTAQGYAEAFVQSFGARLVATAAGSGVPVSPRLRVLFNPELASEKFLLPGLVAFILMISSTIATALSVVKERETGTMEQLLVSPLTPSDVILGKAIPYGIIALMAALLVMGTARVVFGLEIAGSNWLLFWETVIFVLGAQGLGLLISSITDSQQVAFQIATFATMLPTLLLSGFVFPIRSMPPVIQGLTYIVPARYFVTILRGIVLKGVGIGDIWQETVALGIFATFTVALAISRLRRVRL